MKTLATAFTLSASTVLLTACGGDPAESINLKPSYLGEVTVASYDGNNDDLLTAGLGKTGLAGTAPVLANPAQPTAAELRKLAIFNNYRAVLDISAAGGYGKLYGPNIDIQGGDTLGEGKIAGKEYIAYSDDGTGQQNVTLMVQVPDQFDTKNPCIISAASSGSRGVYGAIGSAGEWGLKHRCAVAYTDKGTGNGVHDLTTNLVTLQNGTRIDAQTAGKNSSFSANLSATERSTFISNFPNRVAVKHAHSQQNPEKDWGKWTLQAIEFAYYVLNEQFGKPAKDGKSRQISFTSKNTIVIASSISNGGGAALAALEQDANGLINGLAVSEPNVQPKADERLTVVRAGQRLSGTGKPLYDYFTLANLLQPCAALAQNAANAPFRTAINTTTATNRCLALRTQGLISGSTTEELAMSAQALLEKEGFPVEGRELHASMYAFATPSIAATYSNAYGKFSVLDNLCGYSFFANSALLPAIFSTGGGLPPMGTAVTIYNNLSVGGPALDSASISPSSGVADYNLDGALCQRELAKGTSGNAVRVKQGIAEVLRSGNLRGKPALIVHGRSDTLIPVAFSSRPYYGLNKMVEGSASRLAYIEVANGQHFDAFLPLAGFDARYVPVHYYFNQAMDMMYAHLKSGTALPQSQVVRATARGVDGAGKANPISLANLPAIKTTPAAGDMIVFNNNVLTIPD